MSAYDLGATPAAGRRLAKGLPARVDSAWKALKERLRVDAQFVPPDKRTVWGTAFPDVPNHRHADLPDGWRATWTIRNVAGGTREAVTVLFLGTHKEHETLYGFTTS